MNTGISNYPGTDACQPLLQHNTGHTWTTRAFPSAIPQRPNAEQQGSTIEQLDTIVPLIHDIHIPAVFYHGDTSSYTRQSGSHTRFTRTRSTERFVEFMPTSSQRSSSAQHHGESRNESSEARQKRPRSLFDTPSLDEPIPNC